MPSVEALTQTFLQVLDQAVTAGRAKAGTREWFFYQFKHLLKAKDTSGARIADRDASSLIPEDLAGAPYKYHFCKAVRRLFHWAQEAGYVPHYRFATFQGPPCGERTRTLNEGEYRKVMKCAGRELRRVLWFMKQTFARPGELRQLRWCEIDLSKNVIRLTKFKARDKRRDGVKVRVIPLSSAAARLLAYWKRVRQPAADAFVFHGDRKPWNANSLRLAMARATKASGVNLGEGERVVCYTLRHTGATEATRRGIQDRKLADILGHTSTRTTARYQHLAEEDLVQAIDIATRRQPKDEPKDARKIVRRWMAS